MYFYWTMPAVKDQLMFIDVVANTSSVINWIYNIQTNVRLIGRWLKSDVTDLFSFLTICISLGWSK